MRQFVPNQQKPWTASDVADLRVLVGEQMKVGEIARELGRTVAAVRAEAAQEDIQLPPADKIRRTSTTTRPRPSR